MSISIIILLSTLAISLTAATQIGNIMHDLESSECINEGGKLLLLQNLKTLCIPSNFPKCDLHSGCAESKCCSNLHGLAPEKSSYCLPQPFCDAFEFIDGDSCEFDISCESLECSDGVCLKESLQEQNSAILARKSTRENAKRNL